MNNTSPIPIASGKVHEAPCLQCGDAFTRPTPKSKAAYCSPECRRDAADDRALAPIRKYAMVHPEPTDGYDITYRAMLHQPRAMSDPTLLLVEGLITVQGWGDVPADVRAHIIAHEPEMIPDDIMALAPGDPLEALRLHLGYDPRTSPWNKIPTQGIYEWALPPGVPAELGIPEPPYPGTYFATPNNKEPADA